MDLFEFVVRELMSQNKIVVLLGCLPSIHIPFTLHRFMAKKNLWLPMPFDFTFDCVPRICHLCYAFDLSSYWCPQYVQLICEIKNSIDTAFIQWSVWWLIYLTSCQNLFRYKITVICLPNLNEIDYSVGSTPLEEYRIGNLSPLPFWVPEFLLTILHATSKEGKMFLVLFAPSLIFLFL